MNNNPMRILGIDPGFGRIGYGIIEEKKGEWVHVSHGCIETPAGALFIERLKVLNVALEKIIATYQPTHGAVEELFFYKNVKTALDVGQARGVILLTLVHAGIPVDEYTPLQVKQTMTGYGRADKSQIQAMVQILLHLPKEKLQDDAADALAIALTAGAGMRFKELLRKSN